MSPTARSVLALAVALFVCGCGTRDTSVKETPVNTVNEREGFGLPAKSGDLVTINYSIRLEDGREILNDTGYRFVLDTGSVIAAMDQAVRGMKPHGVRVIECPAQRHWGRQGYAGIIPPNETLMMTIELDSID
jgi:FKBP-type peptidyl-prolyl cis-trans isomerase